MNCIICDTTFKGRKDAKYCSALCRKKASRSPGFYTPMDIAPGEYPDEIAIEPEDVRVVSAFTDPSATFQRGCVICGKPYETPLLLMRFCSEDCKKNVMIAIANGPHKGHSS